MSELHVGTYTCTSMYENEHSFVYHVSMAISALRLRLHYKFTTAAHSRRLVVALVPLTVPYVARRVVPISNRQARSIGTCDCEPVAAFDHSHSYLPLLINGKPMELVHNIFKLGNT